MSSQNSPLPLRDDERVLLKSPARYLLTTPNGAGYNPINGDLLLTSQRLIFKPDAGATATQQVMLSAAGARTVEFPLRRVTACGEQPMRVQWGNPNVLKLQFDNDGREYFVVHAQKTAPSGTWAAAINAAKPNAPELAYTSAPALSPGFEKPAGRGAQRMLVLWLAGIVAVCLVCAVAAQFVPTGLGR
jgi:hypothetical protein